MKKLLSLISAAAFLFSTAACQQEIQQVENPADETVEVTINVSVPDGLKTKAMGDASTLTKVNYEIWDSEWTDIVEKNVIELDENLKGTLALKLIRFKTYNVLFWAQGEAAKHTWTDLREINIDYTPNIENDAFAGRVLGIDATNDKNLENAVVLKRPFAQVNFATDDLGAGKGVNMGDLAFKSAKVTVPGLAKKYDNVEGAATGAAEAVTFESAALMAEPFVINEVSYDYILVFYPLVGEGEKTTVNLAADFVATCGEEEVAVSWTGKGAMNNVPVQANYRTNFFGSIYTAFGDIDVSVDDEFTDVVEPDLNIDSKTIAELLDEATAAGTYLIEGNVTAVAVNATDETKEDVTVKDASGAELTLTLAKDGSEIVVKAVDTYYHVGDKVKVIVEKTAEGVVASDIMNHVRDIAVADGSYWITYDDKYMYPGNEKVTFYYGKLEAAGYKDNAFTFKAVNGGYTIQDSYGRYLYQSGTYTSFNVAAELPEAGAVWGVAEAEGGYVLTNGEYYVRFSSYGNLDLTKTEADAAVVGLADAKDAKERPVLTLSKTTDSVEAEAVEYTLTITSNVAWTAKASEGVTLDNTSGEGNGTVVLTFAANTAATPVEHTVTVTAEGVDAQTLTLTQAAAEVTEEPAEAFVPGDYWIVANDLVVVPLAKSYGYPVAEDLWVSSDAISSTEANKFTFTAVEGGYTISDSEGKYYYMGTKNDGTYYTSFNRGDEASAQVWTVEKNDDGTYTITNTVSKFYIQYSTSYSSLGAYETAQDKAVMPTLVKVANAVPAVTFDKTEVKFDAAGGTLAVTATETAGLTLSATCDNTDFTVAVSGNVVNVTAGETTAAKAGVLTITLTYNGFSKSVAMSVSQAAPVSGNQKTATIVTNSSSLTWTAATHETYGAGYEAVTSEGIKVAYFKYESTSDPVAATDYHIRVYKSSIFVITTPNDEKITNVVITTDGAKYAVNMAVGEGTATGDGTSAITWSGSVNPFAAQANVAQVRIKSVEVTYE